VFPVTLCDAVPEEIWRLRQLCESLGPLEFDLEEKFKFYRQNSKIAGITRGSFFVITGQC